MLLERSQTRHVAMVNHEGKVVVVATAAEPGAARLFYAVKQAGFEDEALRNPDGTGWTDFRRLVLPQDPVGDPSVTAAEDAFSAATAGHGRLLRSIYDSDHLTADAPVQLVSYDGHCYVFRRSTGGSLLADRFVLDGMTNELTPTLEVRFTRSRQRYAPHQGPRITGSGQLETYDSLDFRDTRNQPFTEPTREILPDLLRITDGAFAVVVTPSNEQGVARWHIVVGSGPSTVDVITLATGDTGPFDVRDGRFRTIDPITEQVGHIEVPALTRHRITLYARGETGRNALTVTGAPTATRYDVQREQQTQNGVTPVRDTGKVMVAVPTTSGTAVLSFAVAADGRLAQIGDGGRSEILRSTTQDVLTPSDLLDGIRAVTDSSPVPTGSVAGLSRSGGDWPDRLRVQAGVTDLAATAELKSGDTVEITGTPGVVGLHRVVDEDDAGFVLELPDGSAGHATWKKIEDEDTGLVADGAVTGYEVRPDGRLRVLASHSRPKAGAMVQIEGEDRTDGEYTVVDRDQHGFTVERRWAVGDAVDVEERSRRRRGLSFDGRADWIAAALATTANLSAGFAMECWVKLESATDQVILTTRPDAWFTSPGVAAANAATATLETDAGCLRLSVTRPEVGRSGALRLRAPDAAPVGRWMHVACTFDGKDLRLLQDGAIVDTAAAGDLAHKSDLAHDTAADRLRDAAADSPAGAAADLAALRDWRAQVPPAFCLRVAVLGLGGQETTDPPSEQRLRGDLADVRLWTTGRTAAEIMDGMHTALTGREPGLAGYWRLSGIATEDGHGVVVDFSPHGNHGVVHGAPGAGATTVSRTSDDGTTSAVQFANDDLVAVRENATYVETFEFRPAPGVNAAEDGRDGSGPPRPIFEPSLWGVASRDARARRAIEPSSSGFTVVSVGDGWWRATCRFVVPEGVRLVRAFGVRDLAGPWTGMDVRRHALTVVSDSVTFCTVDAEATLVLEPGGTGGSPPPVSPLDELADNERAEARLVVRRDQLATRLATQLASDRDAAAAAAAARRRQQQALVDSLSAAESAARAAYTTANDDPRNFWCTLTPASDPDIRVDASSKDHSIYQQKPLGNDNQRWKFTELPTGAYSMVNKQTGKCADVEDPGVHQYDWYGDDRQAWLFERQDDSSWILTNKRFQRVLDATSDRGMIAYARHGRANQRWYLVKDGVETNSVVSSAKTVLDNAVRTLTDARAVLDGLAAPTGDLATDQAATAQRELDEVAAHLAVVRQRMTALTQVLGDGRAAAADPTVMTDVSRERDPRGLRVQGVLLTSVVPAGPLHLAESAMGRVLLTHRDHRAAVAQRRFDAVYGAAGFGETWLPDPGRGAVTLGRSSALAVPPAALGAVDGRLTIEFWARPAVDPPGAGVLLRGIDAQGRGRLLVELRAGGAATWSAGLDDGRSPMDSLVCPPGASSAQGTWQHWAFVKDADAGTLAIYRDGVRVAVTDVGPRPAAGRARQRLAGVTDLRLGAHDQQPGWCGQLAELRIWSEPLGPREVEADRLLALDGSEPGLVAYYRFDEGRGDRARDATGGGHHLSVATATWSACTAPLGRLGAPTDASAPLDLLLGGRDLDGKNAVDLPATSYDFTDVTIEARLTTDAGWAMGIVGFADGNGGYVTLVLEGKYLILWVTGESGNATKLVGFLEPVSGASVHVAVTIAPDGRARLYAGGHPIAEGPVDRPRSVRYVTNTVGHCSGADYFSGRIDDLRLHPVALDAAAIARLAEGSRAAHAVLGVEYSRVRVDEQGKRSVMLRRGLAAPGAGGVHLLEDKRIDDLELVWIGNAQITPTLLGYIEGAPPVPSENLTQEQDYNGAVSVELVQSTDTEHSWTRGQDVSTGPEIEFMIGERSETSVGVGVQTTIEETEIKGGGRLNIAYHWENASTVAASHGLTRTDRLELRGSREVEPRFPQLDKRFVPKGIGYAFVTSGLADVFVSRLAGGGRMIDYHVLPIPGVPMDVNTITFLINPAYTMAGSLDGMTGSSATSERYFHHVPEMRRHYGSLYPASYYRLTEAYALKNRIDEQDKNHEAFFSQFNARLVDETSLDRQVNDTDLDTTLDGLDARADEDTPARRVEAAEAELARLEKESPVDSGKVASARDELEKLRTRKKEQDRKDQAGRKEGAEKRLDDINRAYQDRSARANASDSFAGWQKKMEDLQIRAGKRNIVNTYVWDGDGGLHAEEQQFASTVEHTVGGSIDFSAAIGSEGQIAIAKVLVEYKALATVNLVQTMSKTEKSASALGLKVDLSGMESRGITDFRDHPLLPGEKVDRYRFMSFYLEGATEHWHDFFETVVDPEWLAGNDEEARALRETRAGMPNKSWRVLHRVTYVERPALGGVGRPDVSGHDAVDDIRALRDQVTDLQGKVQGLEREINDKLDQLLRRGT